MPAATAAVIYFIRASVIRQLSKPGQCKLLAALAHATSHAIAPPVIVAALEGCGVLLEILGGSRAHVLVFMAESALFMFLRSSSKCPASDPKPEQAMDWGHLPGKINSAATREPCSDNKRVS